MANDDDSLRGGTDGAQSLQHVELPKALAKGADGILTRAKPGVPPEGFPRSEPERFSHRSSERGTTLQSSEAPGLMTLAPTEDVSSFSEKTSSSTFTPHDHLGQHELSMVNLSLLI